MRYRIPTDDECGELLDDREFLLCNGNERRIVERGRRKAWEEHRNNGPVGQLRVLCQGAVGDSILLKGYTRSSAISPLIAYVSVLEGVQLTCKLARSLVDGSPEGVRVTLVAFTR